MKYDYEYNSYKFSSEEISTIIHALIHHSSDHFLDHITRQNVVNLLKDINQSTKISVAQ